jgi:ammonia channel protein AmtB
MISTRLFPTARYLLHTLILLMLLAGNGLVYAADEADAINNKNNSDTETTEGKIKDNSDAAAQDNDKPNKDSAEPAAKNDKAQAESHIADSMANIELIQGTLESLRTEIENSKESTNLNRNSVQTIKNGLELIDNKLKEAYTGLDDSRNSIATNTKDIIKLKQDILTLLRDVRANATDMESEKSLIEDNSVRLYEVLIQMTAISDKLDQFVEGVKDANPTKDIQKAISTDLNRLWMLLSIVLVFFAPLAFILSGNREQNKPLADGTGQQQGMVLACLGVFLGYFVLGFGLMYGTSASGWIGVSSYLLDIGIAKLDIHPAFAFTEFVLYQTGFTMLSALIVYVAVGRQFSSTAHMMLALFVGAILVPIFGHWVSSGSFIPGNKGWLESIGFIDQAGATSINAVAAWFALVIVWKLGNRSQPPEETDQKSADEPVYSSSTTQLLWLSWLGFTTGTLPISSTEISNTMLNVGLAASAGGMAAFLHYVFFHTDKGRIARGLGGFVSGLVAIGACAQSVTFIEAAAIGASAGFIQNLAFSFLRKSLLKHAWQTQTAYLVAIHGAAGTWGTLCFALLGTEGNFAAPNMSQLVIQLQGSLAALAYSIVLANVVIFLFALHKKPPAVAT